ncbi:hypothetical protein ACFPAF_14585 [Hymenobacter endophyticus]|uniref:Uncharacterized protein n=1 Tax=Hymenobacter endophyticus TaxID=3076335 RepID=A0ABU3TJS6_9BACT|nr:hypothetical protein [Hymenobacter endophyticus]MDU0371629.1 hypothetical protein [Hymenobacter endophyticus]
MQRLLYYPGFEPPNLNWLKFSILYCENVQCIVPYDRQYMLSNEFRNVIDLSDLIDLHNPGHYEADRATIRAVREIERILHKPYQYSSLFHQVNTLTRLRNRDNWNNIVYRSKFTGEWIDFCLQEGVGREIDGGVLLSEELAFIFMTHLAKEVAISNDRVIATDNIKYNNYTSYSIPANRVNDRKSSFARSVISLSMPVNIESAPLYKLLTFRSKNRDLISAFNRQLKLYNDNISNGMLSGDFIKEFKDLKSEIYKELFVHGMASVGVALSSYIFLKNGLDYNAEYAKEVVGALGGGFGGYFSIKKTLFEPNDRKSCGKYFANLSRLK